MPAHPRIKDPWGLIQVFTGNGKGKTTAALGTAIRAVALGKKVAIVYFDKGGAHYSERKVLRARFPEIEFVATGLDRIDPVTGRFRFGVIPEDITEAERGFAHAREFVTGGAYDLVVLDEINTTITLGMLVAAPVATLLREKPRHVEVICTGRTAPDELKEIADLVTDMAIVKHYFYHGVPAREGLDY